MHRLYHDWGAALKTTGNDTVSSKYIAIYCFVFSCCKHPEWNKTRWSPFVAILKLIFFLDSLGKEEIGIEEYSFSQSTLEQVEFWPLLIVTFFLCDKIVAMVKDPGSHLFSSPFIFSLMFKVGKFWSWWELEIVTPVKPNQSFSDT